MKLQSSQYLVSGIHIPVSAELATALRYAKTKRPRNNAFQLAGFVQQVHFWLGWARQDENQNTKGRVKDERWWIRNGMGNWQKKNNFPFWDGRTIRNLRDELVDLGILIIDVEGENGKQTTWYTLDYEAVEALGNAWQEVMPDEPDEPEEPEEDPCKTFTPENISGVDPCKSFSPPPENISGVATGEMREAPRILTENTETEITTEPFRAGEAGAATASPRKAFSFDRNADAPIAPPDTGSPDRREEELLDQRTLFEKEICEMVGRKSVSKQVFEIGSTHSSVQGGPPDPNLPSPIQACEEDPLYLRWIREDRKPFFLKKRSEDPKAWGGVHIARYMRATYGLYLDWKEKHPEHLAAAAPAAPPKMPKLDDRTRFPWMYDAEGRLKAEFADLEGDKTE